MALCLNSSVVRRLYARKVNKAVGIRLYDNNGAVGRIASFFCFFFCERIKELKFEGQKKPHRTESGDDSMCAH